MIAALALSADEPAKDWLPLGDDLRIRRLAEGLWLHESDTEWGERTVPANGLIVQGREGAVIVDTPWTEDQTARLLDWLAEEVPGPVLGLLGSHFHPDAFGGIAEVHRRGIMTWGHALTGALAAEQDREAPRQSFDRRWTLTLGDERVEAVFLGPGHSPDGLMVWLPARRILYGGCMVKAQTWTSLGYLGDADLARWPAALRAAQAFDAEIVIPGHGPPGGPELLTHTLGLLARSDDPAGADGAAPGDGVGDAVSAEIELLNDTWNRAWLEKDAAAIDRLMTPDYGYTAPNGQVLRRASVLEIVRSPDYRLDRGARTEVELQPLGADVVAVRHRWRGAGAYLGKTFEDDHRCVTMCVRRGGRWLVASEQCSAIEP